MPVTEVYRRELKYEMSRTAFRRLEERLSGIMERDGFCKDEGGYRVRTLYFDTPFETDYYATRDGLENRKKIRLRLYSTGDEYLKLERKAKSGLEQSKTGITVSRALASEIIKGNFSALLELGDSFASSLAMELMSGAYRPQLLVEYARTAYIAPTNHIRITYDSGIRFSRSCTDIFAENPLLIPLTNEAMGVLEIKYDRFLFSYIKEQLRGVDELPEAFGKYVMSCENA
ncbi:MAG: polyphosphate polymerase domain-containing protein [Oscillospiraceae bacterium]|nr:polyphosphate polymerase domain-containing protein [Oscillospiraceae bacterium]